MIDGAPSAAALAEAELRFAPARLRQMLLCPRPDLYGLQPMKDAMVSLLGTQGAAAWLMASAGLAGPWRAPWLELRRLIDHAREHALVFEELAPARAVAMPVQRAIGGLDVPAATFRSRSFFRTLLADAVVCSKSNFVRTGDVALLDFQGNELVDIPSNLNVDPAVIVGAADRVAMLESDGEPLPEIEEALSLMGVHSFAFGHWISEILPKLWACLDMPGFDRVVVLVDEQMPAQLFEALRLFVGEAHPVRVVPPAQRLRVKRLWAVSAPVNYPIGPRPDAVVARGWGAVDAPAYAELLLRTQARWLASVERLPARPLYLARADIQHRRLINRGEVENWHRERGFAVHDFNLLGFKEQLALVRAAPVVVGPEGSALFATFFARAGTRVACLAGTDLDLEGYAQVTEALGQHLRLLKGVPSRERAPGQYFGDYWIDSALLPELLAQLNQPDVRLDERRS